MGACKKNNNPQLVVWGTGGTAEKFLKAKIFYDDYEVIAYVDNNKAVWGKKIGNIPVVKPEVLKEIDFDKVVICALNYQDEIYRQMKDELGIKEERIWLYQDVVDHVYEKILTRYHDCEDWEIQQILASYKKNGFQVYGSYCSKSSEELQIEREKDGMPFILFEGKKMYYPKDYIFPKRNGKEYISDVLYEQGENSPHLYIKNQKDIPKNSIIVDAGVCEGNFALRYVEQAKKIYLVESDPRWIQALERTFYDWKDKTIICNKFLTSYDSRQSITLDSLVQEEIDFLKMDIEGAETDALLGGKHVLQSSCAKCAVCSYHRQNDEENIRFILEALGYQTSVSSGYMFYIYDENICDTMDFRRGVVYGDKI